MVSTSVPDLVEAVSDTLGDVTNRVDYLPFDESTTPLNKLDVRILHLGWTGLEHTMGSGRPTAGRETVNIQTFGSWQSWNYETLREQNRKIIRVMEGLGWLFQSLQYGEDADMISSEMAFTSLEAGPY